MEKPMQHAPAPVGKVTQIANIFQRKPIEIQPVEQLSAVAAAHAAAHAAATAAAGGVQPGNVVRTESHSARFNNARALFEKLGVESNSNVSGRLLRSGSREDNLCDSSDRSSSRSSDRSQSPPKRRTPFPSGASLVNNNCAQNGGERVPNNKFIVEPTPPPTSKFPQHNLSRLKSEDSAPVGVAGSVSALFASNAEKPEKPERKFNSRELIEKQKKWTSHFTKTKSPRTHSDLNRCDIIRTVPGTGLITGAAVNQRQEEKAQTPPAHHKLPMELRSPVPRQTDQSIPPSPPVRHAPVAAAPVANAPPEIKPRSGKIGSPVKSPPLPPIPAAKPKNVSPVKFNADRVRSPTKCSEPPPPPPAKSAAVTAAMQRSLLQEQEREREAPVPPEKPRKKSIDLIEDAAPTTCSTPSSCASPTSSLSTHSAYLQAAKRGSIDSLGGGSSGPGTTHITGNGLSGSTNSAASPSPVASASSVD
ncbi:pollen-specific leucine-rich repeat extensin-like protein 2 [Scaptodrosophila lebanonensis]|uniref:Pollen-specific leucine-rich repeat extensin-like protein 2 n=1 Tax=Drosophila lebanonensis TaxID=7225 RepID=A0A6J2UE95_DROLE|nr:pollen-specific leucine-rich repeat extensin-like protein 2 [Scaptodrosophila lebanonensis]